MKKGYVTYRLRLKGKKISELSATKSIVIVDGQLTLVDLHGMLWVYPAKKIAFFQVIL